ncbi:MAG: hypothetical protein M1833_003848 [Piccolia ochrophora]|nr:MAG: hypothetical protein M1833_003848 [Piccolia ochrophora]
MPLILITGYPTSGKSHRASQLSTYFTSRIATTPSLSRLKVHHVSPHSLSLPRTVYASAATEKNARAAEYSAVKRALSRDDIVIADGLNYIKGFRYQLYCEAKTLSTPSCVIHIGTPAATCRTLNEQILADPSTVDDGYPADVFDDLIRRYEEPTGMNRWDRPLFTVLHEDDAPPYADIWEAVVGTEDGKRKTVKPNLATVIPPTASPSLLPLLTSTTQSILTTILTFQSDHPGETGLEVPITTTSLQGGRPDSHKGRPTIHLPSTTPVTLPQLQRIRRQFIGLHKGGGGGAVNEERVAGMFVDFLNDAFEA